MQPGAGGPGQPWEQTAPGPPVPGGVPYGSLPGRPYDPTDCVGERVLQYVIDALLSGLIVLAVYLVLGGLGVALIVTLQNPVGVVLGVLLVVAAYAAAIALQWWWFAYRPHHHGDQTWGMARRGLRVVKEDGSPVTLGEHTIRWLVLIVDGAFYGIVGVVIMSQAQRHQRLGDMATHTLVVRV